MQADEYQNISRDHHLEQNTVNPFFAKRNTYCLVTKCLTLFFDIIYFLILHVQYCFIVKFTILTFLRIWLDRFFCTFFGIFPATNMTSAKDLKKQLIEANENPNKSEKLHIPILEDFKQELSK